MATTFGQQFMDSIVAASGDVSGIIERTSALPAASKTQYQEDKIYQLVKVQPGYKMGSYYSCTRTETTDSSGATIYNYEWTEVTDEVVPVLIENGIPAAGGFYYIANSDNKIILAWADADSQDKPFYQANVYFEANGASRRIFSTSVKNACIAGAAIVLTPTDLEVLGTDMSACNVRLEVLYGTAAAHVAVDGSLSRLELTPAGQVVRGRCVNWESTSDIINRPPIQTEIIDGERKWVCRVPNIFATEVDADSGTITTLAGTTAEYEHVKVGDVKKLNTLGSAVTLTAALSRLNELAKIFGAKDEQPDGEKTVKMFSGVTEIAPGGSFREAMVGFSDPAQTVPILVVGGNQATGQYAGLWWTEDGVNFHQSNVTKGDWEQPQYSRNFKRWVAASGSDANGALSSGIIYSDDGKTWTQSNITGPQPEIEIYEDNTVTLFMCGYRISGGDISQNSTKNYGGKSWTNANAKYNSTGCGTAAVPVMCESTLASAIVGYTGKSLYIATSAQYSASDVSSWNANKWRFMCTLVDVSGKSYNADSSDVPWYDIDSSNTDAYRITKDTKFDSVRAFAIVDNNGVTRHVLMAGSTSNALAFYAVAPTEVVTLSDMYAAVSGSSSNQVWRWRPCGVPVTDVTNTYETPEYCGDAIVLPTMSTEAKGDGLYVINARDFLAQHDANQTHTWTHITEAANGGTIHKGGYYKPETVVVTVDGVEKKFYVTTGYKFNAMMLFSENGLDWYKSEYLMHGKPPTQFKVGTTDLLIFPTTDNDGVVFLTVDEFLRSTRLSKSVVKTDTLAMIPTDNWNEEMMVEKINQLVMAVNAMAELVGRKV